jgi:hypothetical protein
MDDVVVNARVDAVFARMLHGFCGVGSRIALRRMGSEARVRYTYFQHQQRVVRTHLVLPPPLLSFIRNLHLHPISPCVAKYTLVPMSHATILRLPRNLPAASYRILLRLKICATASGNTVSLHQYLCDSSGTSRHWVTVTHTPSSRLYDRHVRCV